MVDYITNEVREDIRQFIHENLDTWKQDAAEYDGLDLTIAVSSKGDDWSYQTGDNSFTGGAYLNPHWGVATIEIYTTESDLFNDLIEQIEEHLVYVYE